MIRRDINPFVHYFIPKFYPSDPSLLYPTCIASSLQIFLLVALIRFTFQLPLFKVMSVSCLHPLDMSNRSAVDSVESAISNYSRSIHEYTLRLWTESRRLAEEKARARKTKVEAQTTLQRSSGGKSRSLRPGSASRGPVEGGRIKESPVVQ
ncbi:hypothetical protein L218DRAFT_53817 [Marasmius fiardii PR-910]|nr:hypothetical protein L218DRAFT_53817 [Marasmius fiardii PR-910]